MRKRLGAALSVATMVAALSVAGSPAQAVAVGKGDSPSQPDAGHRPPPDNPDAVADIQYCLGGHGKPSDRIGGVTWHRGGGNQQLRCGDLTKGVLHVDDGHGPLDDSQHALWMWLCLSNIMTYGSGGPAAKSYNWQLTWKYSTYLKPGVAVYDKASGDIVTVYASDGRADDYESCANAA